MTIIFAVVKKLSANLTYKPLLGDAEMSKILQVSWLTYLSD